MAIQLRRGLEANFDASRMVAGEPFVMLDNDLKRVGVAKGPSDIIELATKDDLANLYSASFEIVNGDLIASTSGDISFNIDNAGDLIVTLGGV